MNHILTWCEIPVTDMARAKGYYGELLNLEFTEEEIMDGFLMAMFPDAPDIISGALVKNEHYKPSMAGTIVYLNANGDLDGAIARAERLGSKVLWPKTPIKDGVHGYFAVVTDSEGNRLGLYSVN